MADRSSDFQKLLDIKRRARICADEMVCKTVWQIVL